LGNLKIWNFLIISSCFKEKKRESQEEIEKNIKKGTETETKLFFGTDPAGKNI